MKIGVYGGRFDPIHIGHLLLANTVIDRCGLDKVIFVPSYKIASYRDDDSKVSDVDRCRMINLAVTDNHKFDVDLYEVYGDGYSYTIDTLNRIKNDYYGDSVHLIIGADWLNKLGKWKHSDIILRDFGIIVVSRSGYDIKKDNNFQYVDMPDIGISSTVIRNKISNSEDIRYMVTDPVYDYINEKDLYKDV